MTDDSYLVKLKTANQSDEKIAARLNITVEEVRRRWERIQADILTSQLNGYNDLCDSFTVMANQYQLLGGSLKVMAGAIGSIITSEELEKLVTDDAKQTMLNLRASCIILRRFVPQTPSEALTESMKGN